MKILIILLLSLFITWPSIAQDEVVVVGEVQENCDSLSSSNLDSPDILLNFYADQSFLSHSYNYELENKIEKLKMKANNVRIVGIAAAIAVVGVGSYLAVEYEWKLGIYIPCATVVSIGTAIPFWLWASRIEDKAYELEQTLVSLVQLKENVDISMASYNTFLDDSKNSVGVALSVKF